jgi:ZIP family zinc transporter
MPIAQSQTDVAVLASFVAGVSTTLGALPVLFVAPGPKSTSAMLGFGAGVMIAASAFTLIGGAFDSLPDAGTTALVCVIAGTLLGAALLWLADRSLPHEHFVKGHDGPRSTFVRGAWLFVLAIGLHNLPEGLAVGIGFAGTPGQGYAITSGIVLQNLPEGLVVAASLRAIGTGTARSIAIAGATGLVEFAGGLLGIALGGALPEVIAASMAFAGGAMLYIVGQEVIPESHVRGRESVATWGLVIGFLVMTTLDRALA